MRVLVANAGSSSLKLSVVDAQQRVSSTEIQQWQGSGPAAPLEDFLAEAGPVDAVGHRFVHGGPRLSGTVRLDDAVLDHLASITDLAPLHQPRALAVVEGLRRLLPGLPAAAAFDTAFHARMPVAAATYAVPREWSQRWSLRRYGFHGLSHAYASRRAAELVGRPAAELRTVSCHLGAGSSLAAVLGGRSVDTTMGFTPLAGLVMQTRSGSVDPGLLLWLIEHGDVEPGVLHSVLEHFSGLRGLSGTSGDLREVLAGRERGDDRCALAYDVFVHRLVREVGAMAAALGGLDVLVFTGGIGEHAPAVRRSVADRSEYLGIALDPATNATAVADTDLSSAGARSKVVVVAAAEDLEIARETELALGS